jgi:ketosteroid isomerase-like protein
LFYKYCGAYNAIDIEGFTSFLTEDALCIGSDPSEFFNKEEFAASS